MVSYRYTAWGEGSGAPAHSPQDLMDELSEHLLSQGDVESALRQLMQKGMKNKPGSGLQEMLQQLRQKRQETLDKNDLSSVVKDLQEKLQDVLQTEKRGINQRMDSARQRMTQAQQEAAEASADAAAHDQQEAGDTASKAASAQDRAEQAERRAAEAEQQYDFMQAMAQEKQEFLNQLPNDMGQQVSALQQYDFMDPGAQQKFEELMQELREQMQQQMQQQMGQGGESSDQSQQRSLQDMLNDLNQMLQQRQQGGSTDQQWQDFQRQMQQGGGGQGQSMEDFMQAMQQQARMMQNLLESLQGEQRQQMEDLLNAMMQEMGLQEGMSELQQALNDMFPQERPQRFNFRGDEHLDINEAMDLMRQLSELEDLERQLRRAQYGDGLEDIDLEAMRKLLGDESAEALELLKTLAKELEDAGYLRKNGDKLELTPQGMRKIGQKALKDIFDRLKEGRMGRHESDRRGVGIDRIDETKTYEFGDPFYLDLHRTVRNALYRNGEGTPISLAPEDFEVYKTELQTECTTVLMLDLSWSMARRGSFYAAKKVILALHNLIKTQFPRDSIYIVGFSTYARELKAEQLPYITWDQAEPYTNMQQGFIISQKLLSRHKQGTKQILMITDGEPTAHIERGQIFLGYPPSPRTITETLREVHHCTKDNVLINVFMLDRSYYLREFVDQLTRINRGRAFYTSPDTLGQYVMVDYLRNKRSRIA
ncbi:MAG: VWA domain-containing protein [Dehalococcoidia bacterium]|nr:VWA domain-containing protein [Dehalococcoidia bacterium]